jgi:hypothetical protein
LIEKFQFAPADIKVLTRREETTHQGIVNTFRSFLIEPTRPGDTVYFHYSGHGSQIPDTNTPDNPRIGDELDGLDECLVPSDYVSRKNGVNNIRDDEIEALLDKLRDKNPANITLTFDSCFAGTITRAGRLTVRGRSWEGSPPPIKPVAGGIPKGPSGLLPRGGAMANGYIVISATRNNQTAEPAAATETDSKSGPPMGLLTFSLVKALNKAGPLTTYRDVFEQVNEEMTHQSSDQNPQLEGDIDKVLMSGTSLPPQPYVPITVDGNIITLQAGELQGMTEGSRFTIYPAGTTDFKAATPKAEAEISEVSLNSAALKLTERAQASGVKPVDLQATRAIENIHQYGSNLIRVDLSGIAAMPRRSVLRSAVASLPLVDTQAGTGGQWDVRICPGRCPAPKNPLTGDTAANATLEVQRQDGSVIVVAPDGPDQLGQIQRALEGESRWRFINSLSNEDPNSRIKIELRLVPVEVKTAEPCGQNVTEVTSDRSVKRNEGGQFELAECDYVMVEVRNLGSVGAFVTVLDLQNSGSINPLWPYPGLRFQENRIPPDKNWYRPPLPFVFKIDQPYGLEIFKAIATAEPADFSPLLNAEYLNAGLRDPAEQRAVQSPLGQLLAAATKGRQIARAPIALSDWATSTAIFIVGPRK